LLKVAELTNPTLLRKCINAGSLVNHQDNTGRTALHAAIEEIRDSFFYKYGCMDYSKCIECVEILLYNGSEPLLGDFCRCICSLAGCTPSHFLVKSRQIGHPREFYKIWQPIWSLEWCEIMRCLKGVDYVKYCLFDILRMTKCEELELIHTCCRQRWYREKRTTLEDEEVD